MRTTVLSIFTFGLVAAPVVGAADPPTHVSAKARLQVTSEAFKPNGEIPSLYTCQGAEVSPPLHWSSVPNDTRTIAVLIEDPDAPHGAFTHWLVTGIPSTATGLLEGAALPEGAMAGKNDKGNLGYAGPCPPEGRHHYHVYVFALDTSIARPQSKAEFLSAIRGHVLALGELVGTYAKK